MNTRTHRALGIALLLVATACGPAPDDGSDGGQAAGGTSKPTTPVTPNGPGSGSDQMPWMEVDHQYTNIKDAIDPSACDNPHQFDVGAEGGYTAGPCHTGGTDTAHGDVDPALFASLKTVIDAIAKADLTAAPTCQPTRLKTLTAETLSLKISETRTVRIYDAEPLSQICTLGGDARVQAALSALHAIEKKDYPSNPDSGPEPSPAPHPHPHPPNWPFPFPER